MNWKKRDNQILRSIKRDGGYSNAAFFLGVVRMTAEYVFNTPTLIEEIKQRITHED